MADADMLAEGLPFKRIRAWLTVLTDDTYTVRTGSSRKSSC